jgi:hypothetical protein
MRRLRRCARLSLLVCSLVAAAALPQAVLVQEARAASSEKKKVAVGAFEGFKSASARTALIDALKEDGGYEVTDAEDVKHTAKDKQIVEAAKGLGVNVIITGKVNKANLKLKVRDGSDGKTIEEVEIKGGTTAKLKASIAQTAAARVGDPVSQAKGEQKEEEPPPAEEEAPKEEEQTAEEEAPSTPGEAGELSPLDITAGLRAIHRTFDFHDTAYDKAPNRGFTQLLRYELPLGPALFIDVNFYPGSFITKGPAEWVGVTGGYERGFATKSVFLEGKPGEKTLETKNQHWFAGLHLRFPVSAHQLGLLATYGQQSFILKGDESVGLIPDVKYGYARVLAEANFSFGEFFAGAHVGKRFVLDVGPIGTYAPPQHPWFKNAKAQSLEFGISGGYHLISMLDLVVGLDWLRYGFDFNPNVNTDSYQAGGAVDQYFTGHIAFRFRLPAKGSAEGGAASVSAATE